MCAGSGPRENGEGDVVGARVISTVCGDSESNGAVNVPMTDRHKVPVVLGCVEEEGEGSTC